MRLSAVSHLFYYCTDLVAESSASLHWLPENPPLRARHGEAVRRHDRRPD